MERPMLLPLDAGKCVEVCATSGPRDGGLLGYAIHFAGGWDAWKLQWPNTRMLWCVGRNLPRMDDAIRRITGDDDVRET